MYLTKWFFIKKSEYSKYLVYFTKSDLTGDDYPNLIPINSILSYYTKKKDDVPVLYLHLPQNKMIHLKCQDYNLLSKFLLNISIYISDCAINPKFEEKSKQELIDYCNSINLNLDFMNYQNINLISNIETKNIFKFETEKIEDTKEEIMKTIDNIIEAKYTIEESIEADSDDEKQKLVLLKKSDENSAKVYKLV